MKKIFSVLFCLILIFLFPTSVSAGFSSAKGAVLINGHTGEIIWQQNADTALSMASTTKIMTALLLAEQNTPDKTLVTTKEMVTVEGSSMGLLPGDTVSYRDLLYGMLLASGNDAANTTAIALAGSCEKFADLMNKKAAEIGLKNTHFVTPSGLDSAEHYSTAYDMAMLARYALQNKDFKAACSSMYATLCYGNPPYNRTLKNHNKLLASYEGLIGVKTGYTKKSGRCLVTAAERGSAYLIAVTLCDPNDWIDHKNMLDYGFSVLSENTLGAENTSLPVVGSYKDSIALKSQPLTLSLTQDEWKKLKAEIFLPRFVYAGVAAGEPIGTKEYSINGRLIASVPISAAEAAERYENKTALSEILYKFKMLLKAMV